MRLISHRGNLNGRRPEYENDPVQVDFALDNGFECEIDVRFYASSLSNGHWYLGHDHADFQVSYEYLQNPRLWLHCKNFCAIDELKSLGSKANYFWHENDSYTITSHGIIWAYPGMPLSKNTVSVMPETFIDKKRTSVYGICSDYILKNFGHYRKYDK